MNDLPPLPPKINNLKESIKEILGKKIGKPRNILKVSFCVGIIGFLLSFSSYTPFGNDFDSCFFSHFVRGFVFGGFLFFITSWVLSIIYISPTTRRRLRRKNQLHQKNKLNQEHEWSKSENGPPFTRDDWYNDSTNPISPTYNAIQRSHHHNNHY